MATVLIFDDEDRLLKMIGVYLQESGHVILQGASAESAGEQFTQVNGAVDLILVDVALGVASALEIGVELKRQTPKLKLLFVSDHPFAKWDARDLALFHELPPDSVRVLQRPFSALDLLIKVEGLLGQLPETVPASRAMGAS